MSSYHTFLPGETLTDDELQDLGLQDTYTPALEASSINPTLGSGATTNGDYLLSQGFVTVGFTVQFGTSGTNPGSGVYRITLPSGLGFDSDWQDNRGLGIAWAVDSGGSNYFFFIRTSSSNPDTVVFGTVGTTTAASSQVTDAVPFTWAANDYIRGSFKYRTDFS